MGKTKDRRVFLVGFRTFELEAIQAEGLDVRALVHVMGRREPVRDLGVERHEHFGVVRCEMDPPRGSVLPEDLKTPLFDAAFNLFRRHYNRIAFTRQHVLRSWTHSDNLFFLSAQFFHDLLKRHRITTVIFSNFPHEGSFIVLYHLAKLLDLEILITSQTNFPHKMWIVKSIEDLGFFETVSGEGEVLPTPDAPETPFYMKRSGKYRLALHVGSRVVSEHLKMLGKILTLQFWWNPHAIDRNMNRLSQARDRFRIGEPSPADVRDVDLDVPFIYFPMHLQPEMTTDTWGNEYGDQLRALEALSAAAPEGMLIYAKENPVQTSFMREESFYRRLRCLGNVRYVSYQVPSFDLIRKSACVATITGTAGWEAALLMKGVIHFGVTWYSSLPGVYLWKGPETLDRALAFRGDRASLRTAFEAICRKMYTGVVDPAYADIIPDFDEKGEARKAAASIARVLRET
ncbi:MAG: hypothetical protein WBA67_00525 [Jannaschia sp.]